MKPTVRSVGALVLVLAVLASTGHARPRSKRLPTWEWGLSASAGAIYNSNLIGISERDANRYLMDPAAFPTPLESVDDLENELQVRPTVRWRAPARLMVGADYRFKFTHRLRNEFTDYQTHNLSLSVRPRVSGYRWSLRARLFAMPSYYLRVYRDRDYNEWHAARFANYDYRASGRYRWWRSLWSEAGLGYGTYYYNAKFTEYDSEYRHASFTSGYDFGSAWSLSAGYTRRISDNIGKTQIGLFTTPPEDPEQLGDSEYGDADFNEDDWVVQASTRLDRWVGTALGGSVSYRWRRRVFTTSRSLEQDPFHRSRVDNRGQLTVGLSWNRVPRLSVDPYFTYDERRTDSDAESVVLIKSFVRREYGMSFTFRIK